MQDYAGVGRSRQEYAEVCRSMQEHAKLRRSMQLLINMFEIVFGEENMVYVVCFYFTINYNLSENATVKAIYQFGGWG